MRAIDNVRKIFEDVVAPELQSLHAKIDGLEKTVDAKFGAVDAKLETMSQRLAHMERETNLRFQSAEERFTARYEMVLARLETFATKIGARFDAIERKAEMDKAEICMRCKTEKRIQKLEDRVFLPEFKAAPEQ